METAKKNVGFNGKQMAIWLGALVIGVVVGLNFAPGGSVIKFCDFVAAVYTRLFKFVAVPTIALVITTTLASLGGQKNTGKIFGFTIMYTILTTLVASVLGAVLYKVISPGSIPQEIIEKSYADVATYESNVSNVYEHILNIVPDNVINPFSSDSVLSILIIAAAVGLSLAFTKRTENTEALIKAINGLQEVFFAIIRALVWALPLGIIAFAAQLAVQMSGEETAKSIGKYVAVVLGGNIIQFVVILPLFLIDFKNQSSKGFQEYATSCVDGFLHKELNSNIACNSCFC